MAHVVELFKSDEGVTTIDGKGDHSTLMYMASGYATRPTAKAAILAIAPATNQGLYFQRISIEQTAVATWVGRCEYGVREPLAVGEYTFSWDTTGGTVHLTTPIDCTSYAVAGYTAPTDLEKVILADRDRRVQGVDVPTPSLKLTISYRLPGATITLAYIKALAGCVGKTNDKAYGGFEAGELLFLGATGRSGSATDPIVDFHFLASVNVTGMTLGDITGIDKTGHQYIWPWFGEDEDETADELIVKPKAIYVDTVVEECDFYTLQTNNVDGGSEPTTTTAAP
jgi:hypothetical protein